MKSGDIRLNDIQRDSKQKEERIYSRTEFRALCITYTYHTNEGGKGNAFSAQKPHANYLFIHYSENIHSLGNYYTSGAVLVHGIHEVNQRGKLLGPQFSCLHCYFFSQHSFIIHPFPAPLSTNPIHLYCIALEGVLYTNFTEEPDPSDRKISSSYLQKHFHPLSFLRSHCNEKGAP